MTDITKLAQHMKAAAVLAKKYRNLTLTVSVGETLALVEALEKAQQHIASQREYYEGVIADGGKRISDLESRTVTVRFPPRKDATDYVDGDFSNEDLAAIFNTCRLQCKVALERALLAAGIKWEAE